MKNNLLKTVPLGLLVSLTGLGFGAPAMAEDFQQALVSAYNRNPRLMAERARVRETDESYVQAQSAGRFTVTGTGSAGYSSSSSDFGGGAISSGLTPRQGQLQIIQPLYQGGRVNGLKTQAKAGILSARQGLRNAEQNLLLSAATAYLDVLRDEEAADIRRNNVRVLARQQFAAQDRFDVGEGTRTDIAQADSRMAQAEIGLANAEAQLAISRAAYVRFVGHVPAGLTRPPEFILPPTLMESQLRARSNNPQLVAARYNENAAQAAIHVAKAAGRPTISLNGVLQGSRDTSVNLQQAESASITAQIRIPFYSGGVNQSRVRAAKAAKTRSRFETREAEQAIDQTVSNVWAQVESSKLSLAASRRQVAAAEVAYEGVELEQQVGTRDTLDLLNAEQELLNAKLTVVQAERNLNVATYQLLVTMGGFDAYSLQLPVVFYDPEDNFNAVRVNALEKYVPDPVEKITGQLPNIPDDLVRFSRVKPTVKKVGKDTLDLLNALLPDQAAKPAGKIISQVPNIPISIADGFTIEDPFDPDTKNADPDFIDPEPILIITQTKPSGE